MDKKDARQKQSESSKRKIVSSLFKVGFRVLVSVDPSITISELTEQVKMILMELRGLKTFAFNIMLKPGVVIIFVEPNTVLSWNRKKATATGTQFVDFLDPKQLVAGTVIITPDRPKLQILWPIVWVEEAHA